MAQDNEWTGGAGNWNDPSGWSLGVPTATHNVIIEAGEEVTIPANFFAVAQSVVLRGGELTIGSSASLEINDSQVHGINLRAPGARLENSGTISIGTTNGPQQVGIIQDFGVIENNVGGSINIDRTTSGAYGSFFRDEISPSFVNRGEINIGENGNIGAVGMAFASNVSFENFGSVRISRCATFGMVVSRNSSVINRSSATVLIGNSGSIGSDGLRMTDTGAFINEASGTVKIGENNPINTSGVSLAGTSSFENRGELTCDNSVTQDGIITFNQASFLNTSSGRIHLGSNGPLQNSGIACLGGTFSNSGVINIENTTVFQGIALFARAVFTNANEINIGLSAARPIRRHGVLANNNSRFNNTGRLNINHVNEDGIHILSDAGLTNSGTINIGASGPINLSGIALFDGSTFSNSGNLNVDNITQFNGIFATGNASITNTSDGNIVVGGVAPIEVSGFRLTDDCSFDNAGSIAIDNVTGFNGIDMEADTKFTNQTNATVAIGSNSPIAGGGVFLKNNAEVVNAGAMTINNTGGSGISDVSSTSATVTNSGSLTIGNTSAVSEAAIEINGGSSEFTNQANGRIQIENVTGTVASPGTAIFLNTSNFSNAGTIEFATTGGTHAVSVRAVQGISNDGVMKFGDVSGDAIHAQTAITNGINGLLEVIPNGTLRVNTGSQFTNNGTIKVDGLLDNNGLFTNAGKITGRGTIDDIQSATTFSTNSSTSTFEPGASPGTLTFVEVLDLDETTYVCEIQGSTPGQGHDQLDCMKSVTITNTSLRVDWGSFIPSPGETFEIISATSVVGEFANITVPVVNDVVYLPSYSTQAVTLVPAVVVNVTKGEYYLSIEDAIAAAADLGMPQETIIIAPGTYAEDLNTADKSVSISIGELPPPTPAP
ncbi:hypothetical protein A3850_016105 [Lewinella sp. 4G2]|nr:hypothetical protein A3850_016105 [Lewinella sp. 4G2]